MAKKSVIKAFHLEQDGDMSGNITSEVIVATGIDNVGLQIIWTSADAVGTFSVQGSINYDERLQTGDWADLSFSPALQAPASDSDNFLIDLNQYPFPYFRVVYNWTSGSGTLNVWVSAKVVGG